MNIWLYQKYYIKFLFIDNKVNNFVYSVGKFNIRFNNIKFILTEDYIRKINSSISGIVNNTTIEELFNILKNNNKDIIVNIYPISVEYKKIVKY